MNPFDLMKNLKDLQGTMNQMREDLKNLSVTGSSGGNMVQVTLNGNMEMLSIKLDPLCVDNRDVPMLQDLIVAAHHDAMSKIQEEIKDRLGPMIGSFPGLGF